MIQRRLIALSVISLLLFAAGAATAQEIEPEQGSEAPAVLGGEAAPAETSEQAPEAPDGEAATENALPSCEEARNAKECKAICVEKFREERDRKEQEKTEREAIEAAEDLPAHGWITLGAGLGILVAGAVTGGLALKLNGELQKDCPGDVCPPGQYDKMDTRDNLALSSSVLLGVGIGVSTVGVLLLTVFSKGPVRVDEDSDDVSLLPATGPGYAGATLRWRF